MAIHTVYYPPMTERKVIKGDAVFETFRRKLADKVTWAINNEFVVGKGIGEFCPIGCVTGDNQPNGAMARSRCKWIDATPHMAPTSFMDGFDGEKDDRCAYQGSHLMPYFKLGKLYRERFIERK